MLFDRKAELNILINLAVADRKLDPREADLVRKIGRANEVPEEEIEELLQRPVEISGIRQMTDEEKFEHLYYLVSLMKVDEKVLQEEIKFCRRIAHRLGYEEGVIASLSQHIYSDPKIQSDRSFLKSKMDLYRIR